MKAEKHGLRGSLTVEAALIVPVVIIAVMVVLYIMLIIFQTCTMQIIADDIAERAASVYFSHGSYLNGSASKANLSSLSLYRRWIPDNETQHSKLKEYALDKLQKNSVLKSRNSDFHIRQINNIISQKLEVTISAEYDNPMGNLTSLWGLDNKIRLRVMAESSVDDPAEFMRNSDFIIETASKVPVINDFADKWQEIISRIIEYVNKFTKERKAAYEIK